MKTPKPSISAPLEAGFSLYDAYGLPPSITEFLRYLAPKLEAANLNVTIIASVRDYHLPYMSAPSPVLSHSSSHSSSFASSPASSSPITPNDITSPPLSSKRFSLTSLASFSSFKSRLRQSTPPHFFDRSSWYIPNQNGSVGSPAVSHPNRSPHSSSHSASGFSTRHSSWNNRTSLSSSLHTAASSSHPKTTSELFSQNSSVLQFVLVEPIGDNALKTLHKMIKKASKKLAMVFPPLVPSYSSGIDESVLKQSIDQHEALYTSSSLTVFSLDHRYCFVASISRFVRVRDPHSLRDSAHELRRLILDLRRAPAVVNDNAPVAKVDLVRLIREYPWFNIPLPLLSHVDATYRRLYGDSDGSSDLIISGPAPLPLAYQQYQQQQKQKLEQLAEEHNRQQELQQQVQEKECQYPIQQQDQIAEEPYLQPLQAYQQQQQQQQLQQHRYSQNDQKVSHCCSGTELQNHHAHHNSLAAAVDYESTNCDSPAEDYYYQPPARFTPGNASQKGSRPCPPTLRLHTSFYPQDTGRSPMSKPVPHFSQPFHQQVLHELHSASPAEVSGSRLTMVPEVADSSSDLIISDDSDSSLYHEPQHYGYTQGERQGGARSPPPSFARKRYDAWISLSPIPSEQETPVSTW